MLIVAIIFFGLYYPFFLVLKITSVHEKRLKFTFKLFGFFNFFWGQIFIKNGKIIIIYYNLFKKEINFINSFKKNRNNKLLSLLSVKLQLSVKYNSTNLVKRIVFASYFNNIFSIIASYIRSKKDYLRLKNNIILKENIENKMQIKVNYICNVFCAIVFAVKGLMGKY